MSSSPRLLTLTVGVVWCLQALCGCRGSDPPSQPPSDEPPKALIGHTAASASASTHVLNIDPPDPMPPAGNLREEIDNFKNLDTCVRSRAQFDPLIGDAIFALGYENLKRDACRVVQAAKQRDVSVCDQILSSALSDYCKATVAVVTGKMSLCPTGIDAHDPLCVALAQRDERLCRFVPGYRGRACQGIIRRNDTVCGERVKCKRLVKRWSVLMPPPKKRDQVGTSVTVSMSQKIDGKQHPIGHYGLSDEVKAAIVERTPDGSTWLLFGSSSTTDWPPPVLADKQRISFRLRFSTDLAKRGNNPVTKNEVRFQLQAPGVGEWTQQDMTYGMVDVESLATSPIGAPIRFKFEADLGPTPHPRHLVLTVNTFIRDITKTAN